LHFAYEETSRIEFPFFREIPISIILHFYSLGYGTNIQAFSPEI